MKQTGTVEPQYLEHRWLVYHDYFVLISESLWNSTDSSRKQIFREISLFYHEFVCCVYSLELPRWKHFPKLSPFASWPGTMINSQWLKLSISGTNSHGPKDVRATEVWLYFVYIHILQYSKVQNVPK